jgi:hypothetical protein
MTVAELLEQLQAMPPGAVLITWNALLGAYDEVVEVRRADAHGIAVVIA